MTTPATIALDDEQQHARTWFESLRDRICATFEAIEREAGSDATFGYTPWDRTDPDGSPGGGGVRGLMKGRVFEKVGVNVSTVGGTFEGEFGKTINGAADDPRFFATGISLVAHMANPRVPAVHMNCRFLATTKRWFGGGADLNPPVPIDEDTEDFHATLRAACEAHPGAGDYPRYKAWAEDYFWIPHRHVHRGVGGIFFDHLESGFETDFPFVQAVGEAFLDAYPRIVRRRMGESFSEAERAAMLAFRGRYAEFNLVYDRGTLFGLKTGGNVDAILMSLPRWQHGSEALSLDPLEPGELAAIVTSLEMRARPPLRPMPASPLRLVRWEKPAPAKYRALFRRVGEPWLWFSRLALDDTALKRIVHDDSIHVFAVEDRAGIEVGLLELDFRVAGECELGFFGFVPELAGKGHGGWLMAEALARAWGRHIKRVWVHTCTLDHPAALGFYRKQGFTVFARAIERFADPRTIGIVARDVAPQIALIAPARER